MNSFYFLSLWNSYYCGFLIDLLYYLVTCTYYGLSPCSLGFLILWHSYYLLSMEFYQFPMVIQKLSFVEGSIYLLKDLHILELHVYSRPQTSDVHSFLIFFLLKLIQKYVFEHHFNKATIFIKGLSFHDFKPFMQIISKLLCIYFGAAYLVKLLY